MRTILALVLVVVLGVVGYSLYTGDSITAENVTEKIVKEEVILEVSELSKRIEEAQTASSTEIEEAAKRAYDTEKSRLMTEVELNVTRAYREEIEDREAVLEESVVSLVSARVN